MQRVLLNAQATITETLMDGVGSLPASPPGSATVTITREDGTVLASDVAASPTGNPSEFSTVITNAMTNQLDRLTLEWTNVAVGTWPTVVEVVGGFLFSVAQLRAMSNQLDSSANYPTSDVLAIRTKVEQALESRLGYALVPRYEHRTVRVPSPLASPIRLKPYLRAIRSATSNGTALTSTDLSGLVLDDSGFVSGYSWTYPTIVGYEHGLDGGDEEATQAALTLAKVWLLPTGLDERAASFTSVEGGTYSLATPGVRGSTFGIPIVDEFIQANRLIAVA